MTSRRSLRRVELRPEAPDAEVLSDITATLQRGEIVAMPTDTVYGLLASVNRPDALERLARLKARPAGKPFVVLVADWVQVRSISSSLPPVARSLGTKYWPGPLTLVLPAAADLPGAIVGGGPSVAVRMPDRPWLRAVLVQLRCPVAAPSANRAGLPPATSADEVAAAFPEGIDLLVDGGPSPQVKASTIVLCLSQPGEIVRDGALALGAEELSC